jgi:hypothetical protein
MVNYTAINKKCPQICQILCRIFKVSDGSRSTPTKAHNKAFGTPSCREEKIKKKTKGPQAAAKPYYRVDTPKKDKPVMYDLDKSLQKVSEHIPRYKEKKSSIKKTCRMVNKIKAELNPSPSRIQFKSEKQRST